MPSPDLTNEEETTPVLMSQTLTNIMKRKNTTKIWNACAKWVCERASRCTWVLQKLPIRLNGQEEIKTLRLIQLVIFTAIGITHKGHSGVGFPSYGMAMVRKFDAELKKVLEEVDFEDYNGNQKVLKHAIRKAALEKIGPVFEEILLEAHGKKLERLFK